MNAQGWRQQIQDVDTVRRTGRVQAIHATYLDADGPAVPLGSLCQIRATDGSKDRSMTAEVIRVDRTSIALAPLEDGAAFVPGAVVTAIATPHDTPAGPALLGRVIDALGRPIDGKTAPRGIARVDLFGKPPEPLDRSSSNVRLDTGIRSIDGLLPLARGQRIGIFAPAGVGKTTLLSQLARQTDADVTVIALIGERGREVEALWSELPEAVRRRTILVAATSDQKATMRARAAHQAMAQAEYWRAQGRHVALFVDSVTRLAMALREIGLAAGEPPTVRAFTPNVFATLPRLVERAGAIQNGGAISMIMTVLSEAEDVDDPLSEVMKSLLDGHIILSRALAEKGHFPAIDVLRSVSRQAPRLLSEVQRDRVRTIGRWLAAHEQSRMAREAGLYAAGSDPAVDEAVRQHGATTAFLQQNATDHAKTEEIERILATIVQKESRHA